MGEGGGLNPFWSRNIDRRGGGGVRVLRPTNSLGHMDIDRLAPNLIHDRIFELGIHVVCHRDYDDRFRFGSNENYG